MRDIPHIFVIFLMAMFFIGLITFTGLSNYNVDTTETSLTEALKSSVLANTDYSARLERGTYRLDKEGFETEFKEKFEDLRNVGRANADIEYKFDYLESNGNIKAVKAKVTINPGGTNGNETVYRSNVIVNINSSQDDYGAVTN